MGTQTNRDKEGDFIYKDLTYKIIGAVYTVHKELSNVHKESIYHKALAIEFSEVGLEFVEEKPIDIFYKGKKVGVYRPDFIVDDKVIVEIKVAPVITKQMQEQVYFYIKGTNYKLALLVNFGTRNVGIKRLIYT